MATRPGTTYAARGVADPNLNREPPEKRPVDVRPAPRATGAACLAAVVLATVTLTACRVSSAPTSAAPTTSGSRTVTGPVFGQRLTAPEVAWLDAVNTIGNTLNQALGKRPTETVTRSSLLATADTLRGCSRGLTRLGPPPSPRLRPADTTLRQACGHYDRAATCAATAAPLAKTSTVPGSPTERRFAKALNCVSVGVNDGGTALVKAIQLGSNPGSP